MLVLTLIRLELLAAQKSVVIPVRVQTRKEGPHRYRVGGGINRVVDPVQRGIHRQQDLARGAARHGGGFGRPRRRGPGDRRSK